MSTERLKLSLVLIVATIASVAAIAAANAVPSSSCTLPYALALDGAPTHAAGEIVAALDDVAARTGVTFVDSRPGEAEAQLHLRWAQEDLPTEGDFVVLARAIPVTHRLLAGVIVYNPVLAGESEFAVGVDWRALTMHELGHLLGLAHSGDPADVMYPAADSPANWSHTELALLDRAAEALGCDR